MTATTVGHSRPPTRARTVLPAKLALPPLTLAVLLVATWWIAAALAQSSVFPTPAAALRGLSNDLGRREFRHAVSSTLQLLAVSYAAAVVIGGLAGVMLGLSAFWRDAALPLIYSINSVPKVILYPMFLLFLGSGSLSVEAFAFASGVIPMFLVVVEGTSAVARVHLKLAASLRLPYTAVLRRIVLPTVTPSLATGARLTFGLTFFGLLLAQLLTGRDGLGYQLLRNVTLVRLQNILGEVVLIALLALIPTLLLRRVERRTTRRFHA